jgi:chromosome segregation protein
VRLAGLQGEIDRLHRDIAALGAVNLAALDELTTARERKLPGRATADLTEAMNTLEDAIRKIDGETRELLVGHLQHRQRALRPHVPRAVRRRQCRW